MSSWHKVLRRQLNRLGRRPWISERPPAASLRTTRPGRSAIAPFAFPGLRAVGELNGFRQAARNPSLAPIRALRVTV
jgi:hypothetical protein